MSDDTQVVYYMKDAVFAAADALGSRKEGVCDAAVTALLGGWFSERTEPVAVMADGLAVPVLALGAQSCRDFGQGLASFDGPCFALAAISGRAAYERNLDGYCTAVAFLNHRELKAAMVYDPVHAELFHAVHHLGAYLNGKSIGVSHKKSLMEACVSVDHNTLRTADAQTLHSLFSQTQHIRVGTSFSMELCLTACGRIDAAVGQGQSFIDSAAGLLIAKEAGAALVGDDSTHAPIAQIGKRIRAAAVSPGIAEEAAILSLSII